jgi:hypothetical protein
MITVLDFVKDYCHKKEMDFPSDKIIHNIGRIISHNFRNEWALKQNLGPISGSGFVRCEDEIGPYVSNGYPDEFMPEMDRLISGFFIKKASPKIRTRKPIPAFTGKKLMK